MKLVEKLGLLKMDFLGLKTLTVIDKAVKSIIANRKKIVDIDKIPLDDKRTFKLLCGGETSGVFQFESQGFTDLIIRMHPSRFEDLIAVIALFRPGPLESGMVDSFVDGKHGRIKVKYPHPDLEDLLEETYGVMLYQEQVMKVANILADFSLGQADKLRRAMGKKDMVEMEAQRSSFVERAAKNKKLSTPLSEEKAGEIFDNIQKFASYGFNKSHSAAYALVAYQTAWLKANFPCEFMASVLTNVRDDTSKVSNYIAECKRMRIDILPPDINESGAEFTPVGKKIRFGLSAIKGIGDKLVQAIQEERDKVGPFSDLEDFCTKIPSKILSRRSLETLIKSGAFDSTGYNRAQQLSVVDQVIS
jgi:DNA polymerase-3 subunit alpha